MKEDFKVALKDPWGVTDDGVFIKGKLHTWWDIDSIAIPSDPKARQKNSSFTIVIEGKARNLHFSNKDRERAYSAAEYVDSMIRQRAVNNQGIRIESVKKMPERDMFETLRISQRPYVKEVMAAATEVVGPGETVIVALKGAFKEYLICTDKMVYIYKKGFMTGHTFGGGSFKMPYANITNAEVDMHMTTGYFELSTGGLQNKPLNYWKDDENSPQKAPNAISITSLLRADFDQAAHYILNRINESHAPAQTIIHQKSMAYQIRELKALADDGIISTEEFEAKKKQLLNL